MDSKLKDQKVTIITQQYLDEGKSFHIEKFTLNGKGVFAQKENKETGETTSFKVCEPLFVKETVQNLDTKEVYLDFCYKFKGAYQEIQIGMGQLVPNELIKLMSKGVDIPHEFVKIVATYLREQQKQAPHKVLLPHLMTMNMAPTTLNLKGVFPLGVT
ncbi:hypothetical protein ACFVHQ_13440 [Actinomycetes bacterium NPDC127524]